MLASITPLGERGRSNSYPVTAGAHVVGSLVGGLAIGAVAGLVGVPLRWLFDDTLGLAAVLLVVSILVAVVADLFYAPGHHLPGVHRQVDEQWIDEYRGWVYGGGFGFQLGTGVMTFITTATVYVMLVAAIVQPTWWAALLVGGAFGLTRGLMVLGSARVRRPRELNALHQWLANMEVPFRFGAAASLLVLALCVVTLTMERGVS